MSQEAKQVTRRAGLVALGTMSSRVLGLVRDAVIAAYVPASATDLFWIAFRIPNAFRSLLGEGAASAAIVPVLSEVRQKRGETAMAKTSGELLGILLLSLAILTALVVAFPEPIVRVLVDERLAASSDHAKLASLTRLLFPYLIFMGSAASFGAYLHIHKRFSLPAFSPITLNIALISVALVCGIFHQDALFPLAIATLFAGAAQMGIHAWGAAKVGAPLIPRLSLSPPVKKALKLLVPVLATFGVYQLNLIISARYETRFEGGVSYLFYSRRIVEIPQGVFGVALAVASLPSLSAILARGETEKATALFRDSIRVLLFVALPAATLIFMIREPLVAGLFGRGHFASASHIQSTASLLFFLAPSVPMVAMLRTAVPFFHAQQDTRTPLFASAANLIVFFGICEFFVETYGMQALAIASLLAACAQWLVLFATLHLRGKRFGKLDMIEFSKIVLACTSIVGAVILVRQFWPITTYAHWSSLGRIAVEASISGITYFSVALFFRSVSARRLLEVRPRRK